MRKYLFSLLVFGFGVLFLTGCGSSNKVVCTYKGDSGEVPSSEEITAELDSDGKVVRIDGYLIYSSEDDAKNDFAYVEAIYGDSVSLDGKKIMVKNLQNSDEWGSLVGYTKDEFIKYVESTFSGDSSKTSCK